MDARVKSSPQTKLGDVPCGSCTACCTGNVAVTLNPDDGDVVADYQTREVVSIETGKIVVALARKPNGDCVYLTPHGCGIRGRAPVTCRTFDCRHFAWLLTDQLGREARRKTVSAGGFHEVFRAGRRRFKTLDASDAELRTARVFYGVNPHPNR